MTQFLSNTQITAARVTLRRDADSRASDEDLAAIADDMATELALLQGDLAAGDFSYHPEPVLLAGIAHFEHELAEIARQAERRLRSRRFTAQPDSNRLADIRARFAAMRQADIVVALQTLGVPLQQRGREWWGLCPLHREKSPSFAVNREKSVWCCYGCHAGGDLVGFVAMTRHMSRTEALRFLETFIDVPGVAA